MESLALTHVVNSNAQSNCSNSEMLFHNRPVKADMGSVIANDGVQLSDGKSLVKTKLATLHLGAE